MSRLNMTNNQQKHTAFDIYIYFLLNLVSGNCPDQPLTSTLSDLKLKIQKEKAGIFKNVCVLPMRWNKNKNRNWICSSVCTSKRPHFKTSFKIWRKSVKKDVETKLRYFSLRADKRFHMKTQPSVLSQQCEEFRPTISGY